MSRLWSVLALSMAPQRFAPGFISTGGYDITPTFSLALGEVFFGHRPTEAGSDNKIWVDARVIEALRPKDLR